MLSDQCSNRVVVVVVEVVDVVVLVVEVVLVLVEVVLVFLSTVVFMVVAVVVEDVVLLVLVVVLVAVVVVIVVVVVVVVFTLRHSISQAWKLQSPTSKPGVQLSSSHSSPASLTLMLLGASAGVELVQIGDAYPNPLFVRGSLQVSATRTSYSVLRTRPVMLQRADSRAALSVKQSVAFSQSLLLAPRARNSTDHSWNMQSPALEPGCQETSSHSKSIAGN